MHMEQACLQRAEDACAPLLGIAFDHLLAPIDISVSGGKSARASGVYRAISQARRADDSSLPMGNWERGLKRAEWNTVNSLAASALHRQSKDLQLAAWLLEAQIHQHGFAGIASALHVLQQLCERYWDELYPHRDEANLDHRANVFRWINEKLPAALRQVPISASSEGFSMADWERACRGDTLRASHADLDVEGAARDELQAAMAAVPSATYHAMEGQLADALAALAVLAATIRARFGDQAPSIAAFGSVLEQIRALLDAELYRRGERRALALAPAQAPPARSVETAMAAAPPQQALPARPGTRADAYAQLREVAALLMELDAHSPVPYLVRCAADWGRLNTSELYQEMFIRLGGQINIFELLGVHDPQGDGT